jgi:hypothetical protein
MDFNTGSGSGRRDDDRPLFGGETGGRPSGGSPREPVGGAGPEFTLSDPVVSFIRAARSIILDPVGFFRGIRRQGDFVSPLVFALISIEIAVVFFTLVSWFVGLVFGLVYGVQSFGQIISSFLFSLIGTPIIVLIAAPISLAISAGLYHLAVLLFVKPSNAGFEATFRAVTYSSVAALVLAPLSILNIIPFLGFILFTLLAALAGIYHAVLTVLGIRELHSTTTGTAVLVYLLPVIVFTVLGFIFSAVIGFFLAATFSQ